MARTFINKSNFPLRQGFIPSLKIKLYGDWNEAIRVIQRMGPAVKEAGIKAQLKVCDEIITRVRNHLKNSDLGWRALSPRYASQKAKLGLDPRTLIAYGQYYHAIETWRVGIHHTVYVGVKKGKYTYNASTGKRSSIDIGKIAAIHEFSSGKRIPRRPLWNPTIAEMGGVNGIKSLYLKYLVKGIRGKGIPIQVIKKLWR